MKQHAVLSLLAAGLLSSGVALAQQESDRGTPMDRGTPQIQVIPKRDLKAADVRKIQSALNEAGYDAGTADGIWGIGTTNALRDFQKARGLEPSGQLDQDTVLALGFTRDQFAYAMPQPPLKAADVRQVQESLNKAGYQVGAVDGRWGPGTIDALTQFQRAKGLQPTGKLDHDTVLALGLSVSDFAAGEFNRAPGEERGSDSVNR